MDVSMYERALGHAGNVVAGTKVEHFDDPTPCSEWNVERLLNHLIGGCVAFAAGGSGKRIEFSDDTDHLGNDHISAYERAAKDALNAFQQPAALEKQFTMSWGDTPGTAALGLAIADAVVHGWDLAQATGQEITIEEETARAIYESTSGMMEPKGQYPRGDSFKEAVEVPESARYRDKMLAYLGRKP